jgi:radical SAM superfamily enzyme YgiQ (UPF0313 family)
MAGGRPKVGRILVSINPFVPKPWTPFQWEAMAPIAELKRKLARVRRALSAVPALQVETESPREAYLQTLLSRGDRRVAPMLERLRERPDDWWGTLKALRAGDGGGPDPDRFVLREWAADELLPGTSSITRSTSAISERRKARRAGRRRPATRACHSCAPADGVDDGSLPVSASTPARSRG